MAKYVFDASAILAIIQEEAGHDMAEKYLQYDAAMASVNAMEVLTILTRNHMKQKDAEWIVSSLIGNIIDVNYAHACLASEMKQKHSFLSLGDAFCLAFGQALACPVVTADRAWEALHPNPKIIRI